MYPAVRRVVVLLAALVTGPEALPAADLKPDVLRVGTWNIEWLGRPDRRRDNPQKPDDIAKYLQASRVDVLALNEITHDGAGDEPRTNKTLTEALALLKKATGQEWKHVLFPKEDPREKDQLTGVAWNTARVKMVGEPFRIPIRRNKADKDVWARHPHAVAFSAGQGKTDFVLIPVHMKSNVGGAEVTGKQRAEEAKLLVRALGTIQNRFADDDLVILGDFNCLKGNETALARYTASGLKDLNAADAATWIKDSRYDYAPFDRILVPDDQPEFKDAKFTVFKEHHLKDEAEYRDRLSDHYLVLTEVKVADDDD